MNVRRYKFQPDWSLPQDSIRRGQTLSNKFDSDVFIELSDKDDDVDDTEDDQVIKPSFDKAAPGSKRGNLLCAGGLLLVLVVGAASYTSTKQRSAITATSRVFCQPSSIKDTKESTLELSFISGMERLASDDEATILERALMEGYNEASGGCTDEFERWIYGRFTSRKIVWLLNQTS
jgi:hypothetical protein